MPGLAALAILAAAAGAAPFAAPAGPTVELAISRRGFEPSRITLRRGETTRLELTSEDGLHCFAVDALRVEKRVARGKPTSFELTPERAGSFAFYCCVESGQQAELERGVLVVTE